MNNLCQPFFEFERQCQPYMDKYYESQGYKFFRKEISDKHRDLRLEKNGCSYFCEEKFRRSDWKDFAVEFTQDLRTNKPGWIYSVRASWLHYVLCRDDIPNELVRVQFYDFKSWVFDVYLKKIKEPRFFISNKGYGITLNLSVPWGLIPYGIFQRIILPRF